MYWVLVAKSALFLFAATYGMALAQTSLQKPEDFVQTLGFGQPCNNPIELDQNNKPVGNESDIKHPNYLPDKPTSLPVYPPFALRSGQEGVAYLDIYVTEIGRIAEVRVKKSSGWPLLDSSAMESTREWTLKPGERKNEPACMWVTVPIVFRLEGYTPSELNAAAISPNATSVARYVLGVQMLEEQMPKYAKETDDIGEKVAAALFVELSHQPSWAEASREVAAMLAIEMTPEELTELNRYFATPVMQKFFTVAPKMEPSVQRNQGKLAGIAFCIGSAIGVFSQEYVSIKASEEQMPNEILKRMPRFVSELAPYCSCWAQTKTDVGTEASAEHCGKQPDLEW